MQLLGLGLHASVTNLALSFQCLWEGDFTFVLSQVSNEIIPLCFLLLVSEITHVNLTFKILINIKNCYFIYTRLLLVIFALSLLPPLSLKSYLSTVRCSLSGVNQLFCNCRV